MNLPKQHQMNALLAELVNKTVQASYIGPSSLSAALLNLIQALEECNHHCYTKRNILEKDSSTTTTSSSTTTTTTTIPTTSSSSTSPSVTDDDDDIFKKVALSLFRIETIHFFEDVHHSGDERNNEEVSNGLITKQQRQIQQRINQALDLCGMQKCFRTAIEIIYSISPSIEKKKKKMNQSGYSSHSFAVSLISCTRYIRRILLHCEYYKQQKEEENGGLNKYYSILQQFLHQYIIVRQEHDFLNKTAIHSLLEKQILDLINTILIVLPTQIANAYHTLPSKTYKLPLWAVRSTFFIKLIESALHTSLGIQVLSNCGAIPTTTTKKTATNSEEETIEKGHGCKEIEIIYCAKMIEVLLRHGHSDDIAKGIYQFWKYYNNQHQSKHANDDNIMPIVQKTNIQNTFHKVISRMSSSSSKIYAIFVRSCMKVIISNIEIYPTIMNRSAIQSVCDEYCLPFMIDVCSSILLDLDQGEDNREMIVNVLILSPSPSKHDDIEQKIITRCVVELLMRCSCNISTNATTRRLEVLLNELNDVITIWNDKMFINETDHFQQRHVTSFILDAMDYFKKDSADSSPLQQSVIQEIVLGVTNRLNVTNSSIRVDGMMIAEKVAPLLGESLKFDELDGLRDEDTIPVDDNRTPSGLEQQDSFVSSLKNSNATDEIAKGTKRKKKKKDKMIKSKTIIEIDPDEEYDSDASSQSDDDADSASSASGSYVSSDSEWEEENFDELAFTDDEEDLRPVPKPRFLQECLNLLQSTDDDEEVIYKHETALEEIATLVRDCPPDLRDIAPFLAEALIEIENKYNNDMFDKQRWDGLCALTVCSPLTTVPMLQRKLFEESPLNLRLDILNVMKVSSLELCGQLELEKHRTLPMPVGNIDLKTVANELKTRRWGTKSKRSQPKIVRNAFSDLSPLFFYPLIQGFTESKHNEALWGGENGGRLLSNFLITLSSFVENAANHPGTSNIAADLFAISWSFIQAQNPDVRLSVLVSLATCFPHLAPDYIMRMVCIDHLPRHLQQIQQYDPNGDCRQIATLMLGGLASMTNLAIG